MTHKILVIEDEAKIRKVVATYLEGAGYDVQAVDNGMAGLELVWQWQPDLIVLDLNLPDMDGMQVAEALKNRSDIYIIMLTARGEVSDRIKGLKIGADDYMTKPFSPRELVARVEARLRRTPPRRMGQLAFAHVNIDPTTHQVSANGTILDFTLTQFKLLYELASHHGQVLSRKELLNRVWDDESDRKTRVVDVFANQVRRKLEEEVGQPLIETVRGVGYRFTDAPA